MEKSINPSILRYAVKSCPECGSSDWSTDDEASYLMFRMDKAKPRDLDMNQYLKVDIAACKNCGYSKFYLDPKTFETIKK